MQRLGKASDFLTNPQRSLYLAPITLPRMTNYCNERDGIVIVGGGLAGQRCAEALRRCGFDGRITMLCAEPHRPYDRPPLSKELLGSARGHCGERAEDRIAYRPAQWYETARVELLLASPAVALDPRERRVRLADGSSLRYSRLLIASGSRPRTLPMFERYDNVSTLRTLEDSRRLREVLRTRGRLAVIGAGFIGQEVAAAAREAGCQVTMIEAASAPLLGILGAELGTWFARLHRQRGVKVLTGCTIVDARGNGAVDELRLSNGRVARPDHVVVGVGVAPDCAWLQGSGLETTPGVPVDPHGRTAIDGVFAAGDVACTFDPRAGQHVPGSHWEAAGRQGTRAARAMLGLDPGPVPPSTFWTDQYGVRVHYVGRASGADRIELEGDPDSRSFTATFTRAGRPVAALLVGRPRALPAARASIEKGAT